MQANDLDKLIDELDRLLAGESDPDLRAELTGIRERMLRLRNSSLLSAEARGELTDEARRALGLGRDGAVEQPKTMEEAIKAMADSFKQARLDHDDKKGEVADFLALLWPGTKLSRKSDAATLLKELELTRRFLIAIKKYLAQLNHGKQDGELSFRLADEAAFKDVYYGLLAGARVHTQTIERSGLHRNLKVERVFYDSSDRALIPDLDQRWASLWSTDNQDLQRLHQHNVYSGDTVDYLQREDRIVLLFYPGDVRERWAFGHKRSKPTPAEIAELLGQSGVRISGYHVPDQKKEFASKHKKQRCDALLAEVLKIAGSDGALAPAKQTRAHHALLNRHLSELIRDARIHCSELIGTYERKYTVTEYVGKVRSLAKEIPDVARRVSEWNARYEGLLEQVAPMWDLADRRGELSPDAYKAELLPALRELISEFPGNRVWDFAYASVAGLDDPDGSKYKAELASWQKAYYDDLVATFGEDEAIRLPKDLPIMDLMCMWLFSPHIPKPKDGGEPIPVSVFYWLWKQGHFDHPESVDDWLLPYEIDWPAFVAALPREECEQVHDLAIRVWEVEMFELHECMAWARGDSEDRRTARWLEHGNEIAAYVAEANGVIAFVDTYEGCYDKMLSFIEWVLLPSHELGRSRHYEGLAAGTGLVSFCVSISVEASLFSRIGAGITLSYQYSGKVSQDDDRRVRWNGSHSFSLSVSADAKLTLADIVETQTALDVIKASAAADKQLYSAVTVSVYESPRHLAAVWAEGLARARYLVSSPVNGIATPGGFKRFRGVPGSQTQEQILERVVGDSGKLQEITQLLQRPRVRAKRRGIGDYASDWKLSAELEVPLLRAKAERLAEAKSVMHFSRRLMNEHEQPKERYDPPPVTYTWSKGLYAFPFLPAKLDSEELGFSWTEIVEDPAHNPLDLYPEDSSDPPTSELLGGFLEADNGSFDVGFTHIANHPNPDNDGMYLNIKSYRNWGVGVRGQDVSFSFQRTQRWMKIDPVKLRWHFNYMVEACQRFFREWREQHPSGLPALQPGTSIKEELNDLIVGHLVRHNVQRIKSLSWREGQPLFHSKPGNSMLWRMRAMSLFGAFELNFIYSDYGTGFEVQYGRVWITSKMVLGYKASLPTMPFLKIGAEIAGELSHCCFETLGLYTLSYILTVYNGCRKRYDPKQERHEWRAWADEHREELHALFNKLADANTNTYKEVEAQLAAPGKAPAAARALLALVDIERADHIAQVRPSGGRKPRVGKVSLSSTKAAPTVLGGVDYGATGLSLFCHVGWHRSTRYHRRGPTIYSSSDKTGAKVIHRDSRPIFVVRPGNPYDIEYRIEHPKRIKALELDIFDDAGASVLTKPWTIDASVQPALFDPSKPTAPEAKAQLNARLRWYGSKDGAIKNGAIAELRDRSLQGGAPLPSTPGHYCMVLSVKQATAGPADGAIAWTYFTVLAEPLAKLEDYLQAVGENQDATQKPRWTRDGAGDESSEESTDEPELPALPGRSDEPPAKLELEPPPPPQPQRVPLVEPERQRVAKQVIGVENLGASEGYTCYLNSALQLLIHHGLLPHKHSRRFDNPQLAKDALDFVQIYNRQREAGVDYVPKSSLNSLRDLRRKLLAAGAITQIDHEDDAAAALFGILDACSISGGDERPSKLHFELRVTKRYNPGPGVAFASAEQAAAFKREHVELRDDDTTVTIQLHNQVLIDGLPNSDQPQSLQKLWAASWDADVSGDESSRKYRGDQRFDAAQPLRQLIEFNGSPTDPLLVSLKRFSYDRETGRRAKIATPVEVGMRIEVGGLRYCLVGFIEHIGASMATGHYVAYIKREQDWYCCNDSAVRACSAREVEQAAQRGYVFCFAT